MTAGSSLLRSLGWPKKRQRSGSASSSSSSESGIRLIAGRRKKLWGGRSREPSPTAELNFTWVVEDFHNQVVDCGKEGLHSTALPLSLPLPINTNTSKEEELTKLDHLENKKKSSTIEEEELELTNMGSKTKKPMETSWSLSLSPWRDSEGNCQTSPVVIGLNLRSVSEINFDEDFKVVVYSRLGLWDETKGRWRMEGEEQALLNLKPGRPLQTISYRSLPVNPNNLGSEGEARVRVRLRMEWSRSSTSTTTHQHLHHLKVNKEAPDLLLKAGDKEFPAHSSILSKHSPYIARLAPGSADPTGNRHILLLNAPALGLAVLLASVYQIPQRSTETPWPELLAATSLLEMVDLKQECEQALAARLSLDSVASTLLLADKHNCSSLKEKCEQFLVDHLRADCVASSLLLADTHKCKHLKEAALHFCCTKTDFIMKDKAWSKMEAERPALWEEAIATVEPPACPAHAQCLVGTRTRYEVECEEEATGRG